MARLKPSAPAAAKFAPTSTATNTMAKHRAASTTPSAAAPGRRQPSRVTARARAASPQAVGSRASRRSSSSHLPGLAVDGRLGSVGEASERDDSVEDDEMELGSEVEDSDGDDDTGVHDSDLHDSDLSDSEAQDEDSTEYLTSTTTISEPQIDQPDTVESLESRRRALRREIRKLPKAPSHTQTAIVAQKLKRLQQSYKDNKVYTEFAEFDKKVGRVAVRLMETYDRRCKECTSTLKKLNNSAWKITSERLLGVMDVGALTKNALLKELVRLAIMCSWEEAEPRMRHYHSQRLNLKPPQRGITKMKDWCTWEVTQTIKEFAAPKSPPLSVPATGNRKRSSVDADLGNHTPAKRQRTQAISPEDDHAQALAATIGSRVDIEETPSTPPLHNPVDDVSLESVEFGRRATTVSPGFDVDSSAEIVMFCESDAQQQGPSSPEPLPPNEGADMAAIPIFNSPPPPSHATATTETKGQGQSFEGENWVSSADLYPVLDLLSTSQHFIMDHAFIKVAEPDKITALKKIRIPSSAETILFPILHASHWSLATIRTQSGLLSYFDSMSRDQSPPPQPIVKALLTAVRHLKDLGAIHCELPTTIQPSTCQQQQNLNDCGIFLICNAMNQTVGLKHAEVPASFWRYVWQILVNDNTQPRTFRAPTIPSEAAFDAMAPDAQEALIQDCGNMASTIQDHIRSAAGVVRCLQSLRDGWRHLGQTLRDRIQIQREDSRKIQSIAASFNSYASPELTGSSPHSYDAFLSELACIRDRGTQLVSEQVQRLDRASFECQSEVAALEAKLAVIERALKRLGDEADIWKREKKAIASEAPYMIVKAQQRLEKQLRMLDWARMAMEPGADEGC